MLPDLYEGYVSWKRISQFLSSLSENPGASSPRDETRALIRAANPDLVAFARDCSIGWTDEAILRGLTFNMERGSIMLVTGDTGLGKTTLLNSLVGEVRVLDGFVNVLTSRVAYCDQDPFFLPGGTVREQVLWDKEVAELLILDDVFTGIDHNTAGRMRDALFGQDGFLQTRLSNMAVVLASSSGMFCLPCGDD